MLSFLFKKFSGRHYRKFLEKCRPIVARINEIELTYQALTDEQLRGAAMAYLRPALRSVATAFGKIVPGLDAALSDAAYVRMVALAYGWTHETVFVTASATPGTAPTPPAHPTPAFVPPLFLANHAPVPHAVAYGRVQGGAFEVVSLRAGTPGSAFTLGYGRGTTANKALAYYGFVPAEDGDSGVLVSVGGREVCVRRAAAS